MRLRSPFIVILLLAFAVSIAPMAEGHGAGSGVVSARGSFLLAPTGTQNDTFHVFLSSMGLPIDAGDRLRFSWQSNNGSGPEISFEIHAHPATAGYVLLYQTTGRSANGTWSVPGQEPYMVYWQNLNPDLVNVSYVFNLYAPELASWLVVLITLTPGVSIPAMILVVRWRRRRRQRRTQPLS